MDNTLLNIGKHYIQNEDTENILNVFDALRSNTDYKICIEHIFLKLLYYACLNSKKNSTICLLLYYKDMDVIEKISMRHGLIYSKYIIKNNEFKGWYQNEYIKYI